MKKEIIIDTSDLEFDELLELIDAVQERNNMKKKWYLELGKTAILVTVIMIIFIFLMYLTISASGKIGSVGFG